MRDRSGPAPLRILRTLGTRSPCPRTAARRDPTTSGGWPTWRSPWFVRRQLAERLADASLRPDLVIVARVNVAVAAMPVLRAHVPGVPSSSTPGTCTTAVSRARRRSGATARHPCAPWPVKARSFRSRAGATSCGSSARTSDRRCWPRIRRSGQRALDDPRDFAQRSRLPARARTSASWAASSMPQRRCRAVLVQEIPPRIRAARPDVALAIVGADMPDEIRALGARGSHDGARARPGGSVSPVARVRGPAPVRSGREGKITQALASGYPPSPLSLGAEGKGIPPDREVLIADTPARSRRPRWVCTRARISGSVCPGPGRPPSGRGSRSPLHCRIREDLARIADSGRPRRAAPGKEGPS